ncbi:MAG: RidA family protein [Planctomycetota bacterium]|nr:RidA family protein [Planctomycetota bacterium]MDA1105868.1 RidA family protein [Planctomycetota bacterium]
MANLSQGSPQELNSSRAPEPVGAYPHARRAGDFLFLSGVGPRARGSAAIPGVTQDGTGKVIAEDIELQCRSCFANARAVVEDAGARWDQVVDATVFLTNMKRDFAAYNRVWAECFAGPGNPNPTRTTIEIKALPTPIAVEVKLVAYAPLGGGLNQ